MTQRRIETDLKVGVFVSIGMILVMVAILLLGSTENILSRKYSYTIHLANAEGLIGGAKVLLGGIQVGTVEQVDFDTQSHDIRVTLNVTQKSAINIKQDSLAEVSTQGVLGDKFIAISPGSIEALALPAGSDIPVHPTKGITQFLTQSDQLIARLNSVAGSLDHILKEFEGGQRSDHFFQGMAQTAKNLANATEKLNHELETVKLQKIVHNLESITDKINSGNGTVGSLINDPSLYDSLKTLVGQTNRNRIMRNLVRQTIRDSEGQTAPTTSPKK